MNQQGRIHCPPDQGAPDGRAAPRSGHEDATGDLIGADSSLSLMFYPEPTMVAAHCPPPRIALVSTRDALQRDEDLLPLETALREAGATPVVVCWDDAAVDWGSFATVLVRSTWDYSWRLPEFLRWAEQVSARTRLSNPLPLLRWNADKRYLEQLALHGIATVPTHFVAPDADAPQALAAARQRWPQAELVIKPSISAGSRDTMRHGTDAQAAMLAHLRGIQDSGRHALIQPYLARVDAEGESALLFFGGAYSHAIRKGPLLRTDAAPTRALFAPEHIQPRQPAADELALAGRILDVLPRLLPDAPPLYARVDLLRDGAGAPCVIELELIEPSLFLDFAPGAARRLAAALLGA